MTKTLGDSQPENGPQPENDPQRKNVDPDSIDLLPWDSVEARRASIRVLYEQLQERYRSVIDWYLTRKTAKQRAAQRLRQWSIRLTTLAGIGILVTTQWAGEDWARYFGTGSSVILILAGGFVATDRLFGYSSSWIRYILTELALQQELNSVQMEMNRLAAMHSEDPGAETLEHLKVIQKAYEFLYQQIQTEAHEWAVEFRGNLESVTRDLVRQTTSGDSSAGA